MGYKFSDSELIIEALTHKSHFHEKKSKSYNERLEFLGDTFLNFCISKYLMDEHPLFAEGELSKLRSQIVSEKALATVANRLFLGDYILLGRGEERSGGRKRDALLADTLEAVIAAVLKDAGFLEAQSVVLKLFKPELSILSSKKARDIIRRDYKSRLQELCQALEFGTPMYKCLETLGPDHSKSFCMGVYVHKVEVSRATANTKKLATQIAAEHVLKSYRTKRQLKTFFTNKGIKPSSLKTKELINENQ